MPGFDLERLSSETLDCISEYLGDSFSLACCNKNLFYTIARMPHSSDAGKFREACRAIPPRKVSYWVVTWKLRNFASNYLGISQFLTKRARWLPEYDAINCKVIKSGIGVKLFGNIIMWSAIDKGRLDVVQGIMELGYKVIPRDLQRAAWKGRLSILKYLWESDFRHRETESESNMEDHVRMEAYVSHHAALYGHVHILHYVFDEGGMWDEVTTEYAARGGHFAALRFLHAHHCPWNWKTMGAASRAGHLDMVIFCHKMECPWEEGVTSAAAKGGNLDVLKYLMRSGCPWERQVGLEAASGGRLDMLRYVCEEYNCTVGPWTAYAAARGGHLDVLMYLRHERNCPWEKYLCAIAAEGGHLDVIRFAHEGGCPWDQETCYSAAAGGHIEVLRYAHEHGCPWDEWACRAAAEAESLETLKYLHEHGCPWHTQVLDVAAETGQFEMLLYACKNGCPVEELTYSTADSEAREFLESHGFWPH